MKIVESSAPRFYWSSVLLVVSLVGIFPIPVYFLYDLSERTTCLNGSWMDVCESAIPIRPIVLVLIAAVFLIVGIAAGILRWRKDEGTFEGSTIIR